MTYTDDPPSGYAVRPESTAAYKALEAEVKRLQAEPLFTGSLLDLEDWLHQKGTADLLDRVEVRAVPTDE